MRVTYRFRLDVPEGQARLFARKADWPFGIPSSGQVVRPHPHLDARRVVEVILVPEPEPELVLDFVVDALINDPTPQIEALLAAGFHEVNP